MRTMDEGPVLRVEPARSFVECLTSQEDLLERGEPAVHLATLREAALSYGVAVSPQAPFVRRALADGVTPVRRPSGGTGLLHAPGDYVWAVVLPRADPRVGRDFVHAYARLGRGVAQWLAARGHPAVWEAPPGLSEEYCPLSSRGQVLTVGGRVIGAAAQHATRSALLHHGVLVGALDRDRLRRWFGLATPGPADHLTSLNELGEDAPEAEVLSTLGPAIARGLRSPSGD